MRTLHLQDVPDDVMAWLHRLAARDGLSMSAVAVRELTQATRHGVDAELLDALPDAGVAPAAIVDDLDAGRGHR